MSNSMYEAWEKAMYRNDVIMQESNMLMREMIQILKEIRDK